MAKRNARRTKKPANRRRRVQQALPATFVRDKELSFELGNAKFHKRSITRRSDTHTALHEHRSRFWPRMRGWISSGWLAMTLVCKTIWFGAH